MLASVRLAFGLLTVLPTGQVEVSRRLAGQAMALAPLVGVVVGALASSVGALTGTAGAGALTAAALTVAALAVLTRGLHLDGLADTADGLGSGRDPARALAVMHRSDVGPFGVVTLVLVLLVQVAALTNVGASASWPAATAVVLAVTTGRLAACCSCVRGLRPARHEGLGALVTGTVSPVAAATGCLLVVALATLAGAWSGLGAVRAAVAVVAGLVGAAALLVHTVRRLGGVTGDVLGALVEAGTTVSLVVCAFGADG